MMTNTNNSIQGSYNPFVFLNVAFSDRYRYYGTYDFVVDLDYLNERLADIIERSNEWKYTEEILYNQVMQDRFRPKIRLKKFSLSVIHYLCSMPEFQRGFSQMVDKGNVFVLNIDVDDRTQSKFYHNEPERLIKDYSIPDRSQYVGNSEILISFRSKYSLLDNDEKKFFTYLARMAFKDSGNLFLEEEDTLHDWFLAGEYENRNDYLTDDQFFHSILNKLYQYEFITIKYMHDEDGVICLFEFSICDENVVRDVIKINSEADGN